VSSVALPLVTFRWTYSFDRDGTVLTSDSTLRFRDRAELSVALDDAGSSSTRCATPRIGRERSSYSSLGWRINPEPRSVGYWLGK
jgi:hypothetical protein